jgi:hypothetical protein
MNFVLPSLALMKRELLTSLRRKRSYLLLLLVVSFVFFVFFVGLFEMGRYGAANMANDAAGAFIGLTGFLYFVGVLLAPAMAGASICVEKQQGSFELLSTSLIRPSGILFAKMVNSLTFFYLIVIALMPLVGILFFFVGVDWTQFFLVFLQITLSVTGCTAAGLLCSSWFHRTITAQAASFVLSAIYLFNAILFVPAFTILFLQSSLFHSTSFQRRFSFLEQCAEATPVIFLVEAWEGRISPAVFGLNLLYHGAFLTVFLFLALLVLRRPPRTMKVDTRKPIDDTKVLKERRKRFPFYLIDPQRRRKPISDRRNPMYVKEIYSGILGRGTQRARMFYVALICSFFPALALAFEMTSHIGELVVATLLVETCFFLVVAPLSIANALPKEYELGNMDGLRSTLLRPRAIVLGKLFGGLMGLVPLILGATTGTLICMVVALLEDAPATLFAMVTGYAIMFVCLFWLLSTALYVTTFCRKTLTAVVAAYATGIILFLVLPIGMLALGETLLRPMFGRMDEIFLVLSPLTMAVWYLESYRGDQVVGLYIDLLVFFLLSLSVLNAAVRRFARQGHPRFYDRLF